MITATIQQLKQQNKQMTNMSTSSDIPQFWLTDWLLHVIDKSALFLITDDNYQLTETEFEQFNAGVTKMQQGMPLAYLTGHQEFWSLDFMVNEHTLIPRPDTEILVEQVLQWINKQDNVAATQYDRANKRLLDLGTGSGCIAISLAHELLLKNDNSDNCKDNKNSWQVVAVDISGDALDVARRNATTNNTTNMEFVQSSWYSALSTDFAHLFDIIVSNPPYIDAADEHLAGLLAEPISALSAPNQGLADIEHILKYAPRYLHTGGLLAIEHGFNQGSAVRQLFVDNDFIEVQTIQDFGGNDRVTLGQLKAL